MAPAGCAPAFSDHSAVVASANSISITRFSYGGSIFPQRRMPTMVGQQHVRVAALVHRAGDARVVHFVETLHGLVAVVLSALQQVMRGHGTAVLVDVVAALAVGEDLEVLDEAGGVGCGWGQRVGAVRVPDAEGDLDGLGDVPLVSGMRQTERLWGRRSSASWGSTARLVLLVFSL